MLVLLVQDIYLILIFLIFVCVSVVYSLVNCGSFFWQDPMVVVMLVECTLPAIVVITYLMAVMYAFSSFTLFLA